MRADSTAASNQHGFGEREKSVKEVHSIPKQILILGHKKKKN
jgi:hypothetical protein